MRLIRSRSHEYTVEEHGSLDASLTALAGNGSPHFLVDRTVYELYSADLQERLPPGRTLVVTASEHTKSYAALEGVFLSLLEMGLNRSGTLVVIGGGVLQDAGCFIASVLGRGLQWNLLPTTLLAQADSCIGSKSSINIGAYKNQIGTFYPPHRISLVATFLRTLPFDEIRSGMGEILKLQLLSSESGFQELCADVQHLWPGRVDDHLATLTRWIHRSMDVKQPLIEEDEFDRGRRLLLNYGHTFGHAFESCTNYAIPHGIAVTLGMIAATDVSRRLGMVSADHATLLSRSLLSWHTPYAEHLTRVTVSDLLAALSRDKKNAGTGLTCILTRGFGHMERTTLSPRQVQDVVVPSLETLISSRFVAPQ